MKTTVDPRLWHTYPWGRSPLPGLDGPSSLAGSWGAVHKAGRPLDCLGEQHRGGGLGLGRSFQNTVLEESSPLLLRPMREGRARDAVRGWP